MSSQYDFDTIIDRHHTGAMKTDVLCERYGREDLIPYGLPTWILRSPPV